MSLSIPATVHRKVEEILDGEYHELYKGQMTYSIHLDGHFTLHQLEVLVKLLREDLNAK